MSVSNSAADDLYGNNVTIRQGIDTGGSDKIWLVHDRPLPSGKIKGFHFYMHPGDEDGPTVQIRYHSKIFIMCMLKQELLFEIYKTNKHKKY